MGEGAEAKRPDPFAAIRVQFLAKIEADADLVDGILAEISAQEGPVEARQMAQVGAIAHKVSGVAATLGFDELGEAAAALDVFIILGGFSQPESLFKTKELISLFLQELDFALEQDTGR